jgi:gamma-glutamylcyclotransferase (GGCT)/AIG2-like uncharacterized protein YtfP
MKLEDIKYPLYLFVYGTLKSGMSNNHFLNNAEFICHEEINGYGLYSNGYYPIMYPNKSLKRPIQGEVWCIKDIWTMSKVMRLEQGYKFINLGYKHISRNYDPLLEDKFFETITLHCFIKEKSKVIPPLGGTLSRFWKRYYKSNWTPHHV